MKFDDCGTNWCARFYIGGGDKWTYGPDLSYLLDHLTVTYGGYTLYETRGGWFNSATKKTETEKGVVVEVLVMAVPSGAFPLDAFEEYKHEFERVLKEEVVLLTWHEVEVIKEVLNDKTGKRLFR